MKKRLRKKKGIIDLLYRLRQKKNPHYRKGWGRLQEFHINAVSRGGKNEKQNKKSASGKFHYCWHQILDRLDRWEIKFFLLLLLSGTKTRWSAKEIHQLHCFIKEKRLNQAEKLCGLFCAVSRRDLTISEIGQEFKSGYGIERLRINSKLLWCWQELFGDLCLSEAQIFICLFLDGSKKIWKVREIRNLRHLITAGRWEEARRLSGMKASTNFWLFKLNGFARESEYNGQTRLAA
ncbi:MAG: hypothetical protein MUC28_02745 [Planctomycetes bacterium]|nr:hypothetical protein [Planctomycetota bacterium]